MDLHIDVAAQVAAREQEGGVYLLLRDDLEHPTHRLLTDVVDGDLGPGSPVGVNGELTIVVGHLDTDHRHRVGQPCLDATVE